MRKKVVGWKIKGFQTSTVNQTNFPFLGPKKVCFFRQKSFPPWRDRRSERPVLALQASALEMQVVAWNWVRNVREMLLDEKEVIYN